MKYGPIDNFKESMNVFCKQLIDIGNQ